MRADARALCERAHGARAAGGHALQAGSTGARQAGTRGVAGARGTAGWAGPGRAAGPMGCALDALGLFLARFDSVVS